MGRADFQGEDPHDGDATARTNADDPVEAAIDALRSGRPICVHDFDDREGETDLIYPAGAVDPTAVARLRNDAGGLICVALGSEVADAAGLPYLSDALDHPAVGDEQLAYGDRSSFSLTVNHRGTYTGITDDDRSLTITSLAEFAAEAVADDADEDDFAERFRVPGHVHLLRAAPGLLADRRGHTELGLALAAAADLPPAVVVCEMLDDETGDALSPADARVYAARHGLPFVDGDEIVERLG